MDRTKQARPIRKISKASRLPPELHDFKTGAGTNAVMGLFAVKLGEQDMLDLAAYYSYLPRQPGSGPDDVATVPRIVARGAPMRNISACPSCHGTTDAKLGTPWLDGQSAVYIKAQLEAFATDARQAAGCLIEPYGLDERRGWVFCRLRQPG